MKDIRGRALELFQEAEKIRPVEVSIPTNHPLMPELQRAFDECHTKRVMRSGLEVVRAPVPGAVERVLSSLDRMGVKVPRPEPVRQATARLLDVAGGIMGVSASRLIDKAQEAMESSRQKPCHGR